MDKQTLKKHHFWILLALAIVLIPVALGGAVFGVGGMAEEKSKKIDDKLKALNKQAPKSTSYREKLDEQKTELQRQKDRVWDAAYGAQKGLIHWPSRLKPLNDQMDKGVLRFGDNLVVRDLDVFRGEGVYLAEYKRLPDVIAPTEFVDHSWQKALNGRFVETFAKTPSPEEAWLALEDLCVQREVLHDIHEVNQMIAEFLPVPQPVKEPAKPLGKAKEELDRYQEEMKRYTKEREAYDAEKKKVDEELVAAYAVKPNEFAGRFISPYWQLDIVVGRPAPGQARAGELSFRGKLTNTGNHRQNVAKIEFKVWLTRSNADYAVLPVQEEYLAAGASVKFEATRQAPNEPTLKVYKVEQKLDAHYAPVKQLVQLELGEMARSHRFADKGLVPSAFSKEEMDKTPPPPANPSAGAGPGVPGGAQAPITDLTPNHHIPRNRYLERTEQVRRMPVAIVMIVDQGHVQDVIRALSNSRLRFQNTQIHYQRYRGIISLDGPGGTAEGPPPAGVPPSIRPGVPFTPGAGGRDGDIRPSRRGMGFGGGPGGNRRDPRGFGPPGRPGPDPNIGPAVDEENNNLVELTVYGLISLYEQFPPRAAAGQVPPTAQGAAPPAPAPVPPAVPLPPNVPVPPAPAPAGGLPPPAPAGPNPTANPPSKTPPSAPTPG